MGTVRCVRVSDDAAFTSIIEQGTNFKHLFILWWDVLATPANPAARTRIAHSNWVGLLRQAMASNIIVIITHSANSSIALNVQLGPW
jgi:hypothetical protein